MKPLAGTGRLSSGRTCDSERPWASRVRGERGSIREGPTPRPADTEGQGPDQTVRARASVLVARASSLVIELIPGNSGRRVNAAPFGQRERASHRRENAVAGRATGERFARSGWGWVRSAQKGHRESRRGNLEVR